jgi:hypothetical protein
MQDVHRGDLFACRWQADEDAAGDTFRVVEVQALGDGGLTLWAYGDPFDAPPAAVNVDQLRRMKLHEHLGGPVDVPRAEFMSWKPVRVRRDRA